MPIFDIRGVFPNILLVGLVILTLLDFQEDSLILAGVGGLIYDFYSPMIFGLNTFYFFIIIFLINFLAKRFFPSINIFVVILIVFLINLIYGLLIGLIENSFFGWNLIIESVYAVFIAIIFYLITLSLYKPNQIIKVAR